MFGAALITPLRMVKALNAPIDSQENDLSVCTHPVKGPVYSMDVSHPLDSYKTIRYVQDCATCGAVGIELAQVPSD